MLQWRIDAVKLLTVISVVNAQYYYIRNMTLKSESVSTVSVEAAAVHITGYYYDRVWSHTQVTCYDNKTGKIYYEDRLERNNEIKYVSGPLTAGRRYTFKICLISEKDHCIGIGIESIYLEQKKFCDSRLYQDENDYENIHLNYTLCDNSLHDDFVLNCTTRSDNSNSPIQQTIHPSKPVTDFSGYEEILRGDRTTSFARNMYFEATAFGVDAWYRIDFGDRLDDIAAVQINVSDASIHLRNVALGQPARQSSTFGYHTADLAVNGITEGFYDYTLVSRTDKTWWYVDLQALYQVEIVIVYNRQGQCGEDPCGKLLRAIKIMTSTVAKPRTPIRQSSDWDSQSSELAPYGIYGVIQILNLVTTSHVAVYSSAAGEKFALAEVEVYSGHLSNYAYHTKISTDQATTYKSDDRYSAQNAVDGTYNFPRYSLTNSREEANWWMITLVREYAFETIVIYNNGFDTFNLPDGRYFAVAGSRWINVLARVRNSPGSYWTIVIDGRNFEVSVLMEHFDYVVLANQIRIQATDFGFLALKEVLLYIKGAISFKGESRSVRKDSGTPFDDVRKHFKVNHRPMLTIKTDSNMTSSNASSEEVLKVRYSKEIVDSLTTIFFNESFSARYLTLSWILQRTLKINSIKVFKKGKNESRHLSIPYVDVAKHARNGDVLKCHLQAAETSERLNRKPHYILLAPTAPVIIEENLKIDSVGIPYMEISTMKRTSTDLFSSIIFTITDLLTRETREVASHNGTIHQVNEIVYGKAYSMTITAKNTYNGQTRDSQVYSAKMLSFAPLPPRDLYIHVDGTSERLLLSWTLYPETVNHINALYLNSSAIPIKTFKLERMVRQFELNGLDSQLESYTFYVWTSSDATGNSSVLSITRHVYTSYTSAKSRTGLPIYIACISVAMWIVTACLIITRSPRKVSNKKVRAGY